MTYKIYPSGDGISVGMAGRNASLWMAKHRGLSFATRARGRRRARCGRRGRNRAAMKLRMGQFVRRGRRTDRDNDPFDKRQGGILCVCAADLELLQICPTVSC
jgi:hypothetical protein